MISQYRLRFCLVKIILRERHFWSISTQAPFLGFDRGGDEWFYTLLKSESSERGNLLLSRRPFIHIVVSLNRWRRLGGLPADLRPQTRNGCWTQEDTRRGWEGSLQRRCSKVFRIKNNVTYFAFTFRVLYPFSPLSEKIIIFLRKLLSSYS